MKISGHLHVPVALPPRKETLVQAVYRIRDKGPAGLDTVGEKNPYLYWETNLGGPARS
jgi:hypothetical protein